MGRWGMRWRAGLVALLLVAAQGCWLQTGFSPRRTGSNPLEQTITASNVADLEPAWTTDVSTTNPPGAVVVWRDTAYVRSSGALTALDAVSGEARWTSTSLEGDAAPALAENRLWVPTSGPSCHLVAVDMATGATVDSTLYGGPDYSNLGTSACGSGPALSVGTKILADWNYLAFVPAPRCPQGAWDFESGVAALDHGPDASRWDVTSQAAGCGTPPSQPSITRYRAPSSDGRSVFVPADTGIVAYPVADCGRTAIGQQCRATWSRSVGEGMAAPPVALDNGDLAVPMADGRIVVLDAATGEPQWTGNVGAAVSVPLAATGTTIYAAASDGTLAAFPAGGCGQATCGPEWTATTSAPASAAPSVGGDVVYVGDGAGGVTALPAAGCGAPTCEALWTGSAAEAVTGPPVISDGTLYVPGSALGEGGTIGSVTAFRVSTAGSTSR
jgi:hypothetical protein